jgi:long-chain acyl-CoA synthetase
MSDYRIPLVMPSDAPQMQHMGGYGQTEIGGLVNLLWFGGSAAGRASPFIQIMIGDENGQELPPGETGEILARGPLVMCGYWNRPEENARRVVNGWHRTNDLGKRLPDGSLVFVGPKTTMIKTGIENVYPAEVETCLRQHEGVADVCVIGVPDPTWDQNIKAVIVRKPGGVHAPEDFIEHCRQHLASYKKPKIVAFTDQLPRTAAGTVDRDAVDAAFGGGGYPSVG